MKWKVFISCVNLHSLAQSNSHIMCTWVQHSREYCVYLHCTYACTKYNMLYLTIQSLYHKKFSIAFTSLQGLSWPHPLSCRRLRQEQAVAEGKAQTHHWWTNDLYQWWRVCLPWWLCSWSGGQEDCHHQWEELDAWGQPGPWYDPGSCVRSGWELCWHHSCCEAAHSPRQTAAGGRALHF